MDISRLMKTTWEVKNRDESFFSDSKSSYAMVNPAPVV